MLDNILCLDFEASTLGELSYPIEVGVVDVRTLASRAWLIHPTEFWLSKGAWSEEAAGLHKISLDQLKKEGLPVIQVTEELADLCKGKKIFSDARSYDSAWLDKLYSAADMSKPPFELEHFFLFAKELAISLGKDPDSAITNSMNEARMRFPAVHRAVADARRNAEMLRLIAGVA